MEQFAEVADRVWVARHAWLDVNVTAVLGARGLLLVDTLGSTAAAEDMLDRLRRVSTAPVLAVVNTHAHWDHVLGNSAVRAHEPDVRFLAHEATVSVLPESVARVHSGAEGEGVDDEHRAQVLASPLLVPEEAFSSVLALDLGDRYVEVVHCGRGHTAGDAVVLVPDADVLLAGDLVEEGSHPGYGADCWPLEWPASLEVLAQLTTPGTVVVPGHGAPVGQQFVQDQRHDLGRVAETIRDLAGRGASLQDVLAHDEWPYPREVLEQAVRRGYDHLPAAARRLPLA